ncbi:hypothetical protein AAMO2058_001693400 [Amorphochlora amoebiformis]
MGKSKGDIDDAMKFVEDFIDYMQGKGKKGSRKLRSLNTLAEETHRQLQDLKRGLSKADLPPQMKAQVHSLQQCIDDDRKLIDEWSAQDKLMAKYLVLIPVIKPLILLLLPAISISLSATKLGNGVVILGFISAVVLLFFFKEKVEEFAAAWQGTYDKQYKKMAETFEEYQGRIKEFKETQEQLRQARAFDVSTILKEYPDAKGFWIDQFGADKQSVPTTQFIEVLLDWRNKLDMSRGIKVLPLTEKERKTIYQTIEDIIDRNKDGDVAPTELANVLSYFGPLHQIVPKMRCLLTTDEDNEPIRSPWFVWTNVASQEIEEALKESEQCIPCFVVRASETQKAHFAVTRVFMVNGKPETKKYLVPNSQRQVGVWRMSDIANWAGDRILMDSYVPFQSGDAEQELEKSRVEEYKEKIIKSLINDPEHLFKVGAKFGANDSAKLTNWDYVTIDDVQIFSKTLDKTNPDRKMLESLHKSLVKGLDAKNLGLEKEEGYFSTNQLLRSFDEVKFQIVELQKLMKGNHDIDEDDKKASKSSVHHQLPDWKELFKAAVKSLIQARSADFVTLELTKMKKKKSTDNSDTINDDDQSDEWEEFGKTIVDKKTAKLHATEIIEMRSDVGRLCKTINSKVAKPLADFTAKVVSLVLRVEIRSKISGCMQTTCDDQILRRTLEIKNLMNRRNWMSRQEANDWAKSHPELGPSGFGALMEQTVELKMFKEKITEVVGDPEFQTFLQEMHPDEDDEGLSESETKEKKFARLKLSSQQAVLYIQRKFQRRKTIMASEVRDWLLVAPMDPPTRAIMREALEETASDLLSDAGTDKFNFTHINDLARYLDDLKVSKRVDAEEDKQGQTSPLLQSEMDRYHDLTAAITNARIKRNKILKTDSEGSMPLGNLLITIKQQISEAEEWLHPSDWTVQNVKTFLFKVLKGQFYPKICEQVKYTEIELQRGLTMTRRVVSHMGIHGNALLMLDKGKIRKYFRPAGKEIVRQLSGIIEEAVMLLRLDLRLGYHTDRFSAFFYPTLAEYVDQAKNPPLTLNEDRPWFDPDTKVKFNIRGIPYLIFVISYLISHIQYPISNIPYPISHIQYSISNIQYPISHIPYPDMSDVVIVCYAMTSPTLVKEVAMDLLMDRPKNRFQQWDLVIETTGPSRWKSVYQVLGRATDDTKKATPVASRRTSAGAGDVYLLKAVNVGVVKLKTAKSQGSTTKRKNTDKLAYDGEDLVYKVSVGSGSRSVIKRKHHQIARYHSYHVEAISQIDSKGGLSLDFNRNNKSTRSNPGLRKAKKSPAKKHRSMYESMLGGSLKTFSKGDCVDYYSKNKKKWFPGTVSTCGEDGQAPWEVKLEGGVIKTVTEHEYIREREEEEEEEEDITEVGKLSEEMDEGMEVMEVSQIQDKQVDGGDESGGEIIEVISEFDEGVEPEGFQNTIASPKGIYTSAPPQERKDASGKYHLDQLVQYFSASQKRWFDAKIVDIIGDKIVVRLDLSHKNKDVHDLSRIRAVNLDAGPYQSAEPVAPKEEEKPSWQKGDLVEYLSRTQNKWFPAVVEMILPDGKIKVQVNGFPKVAEADQIRDREIEQYVPASEKEATRGNTAYGRQERKRYNQLKHSDVEKKPTNENYSALNEGDMDDKEDSSKYSQLRNSDMQDSPYGASASESKDKNLNDKPNQLSENNSPATGNYGVAVISDESSKAWRVAGDAKSLDDLLSYTGAWHPEMSGGTAAKSLKTALQQSTADAVFLFRKSSSRKPPGGSKQEIFVLSAANRKGSLAHFIVYWEKNRGICFEQGEKVPKELQQMYQCRDIVEYLSKAFKWDSAIGV